MNESNNHDDDDHHHSRSSSILTDKSAISRSTDNVVTIDNDDNHRKHYQDKHHGDIEKYFHLINEDFPYSGLLIKSFMNKVLNQQQQQQQRSTKKLSRISSDKNENEFDDDRINSIDDGDNIPLLPMNSNQRLAIKQQQKSTTTTTIHDDMDDGGTNIDDWSHEMASN